MKIFTRNCVYFACFIASLKIYHAQVTGCGIDVPFYQVNLAGQPSGIWYSPEHQRAGNCCGTQSPDRCTSFEILLDSAAAMINFNIASGAIPTGAMFYQVNCGPQIPVGQPICVTGPGPHHLTFCKPGNNQNTYLVQSIPKPMIPSPQHVRLGCAKKLQVIGLDSSSVTWNSIYPGALGQYNSYLSCTVACTEPLYNPPNNAPPFIDFQVCGMPIATPCGFVAMCDTVRVFNDGVLSGGYSPNPATFCSGGSGILLNAIASGGYGNYSYIWRDQSSTVVGTSEYLNTNIAGNYTIEIRDALYNPLTCPSYMVNVSLVEASMPIVNAGTDQMVCNQNSGVILSGTVTNASGGIWSGGSGIFFPDNHSLNATYLPTSGEIAAGSVTLTLTSFGAAPSCINAYDQINVYFSPPLQLNFSNNVLPCAGSSIDVSAIVTGGISPYNFSWSTGSSLSSVHVGQGEYCLSVVDQLGCVIEKCLTVNSPLPLSVSYSVTPVSCYHSSNGSIDLNLSGGTAPYQFLWSNGGSSEDLSGLGAGTYTVTASDINGCSVLQTVVIGEPDQLSVSIQHTNVSCFGKSDAVITAQGYGGNPPYIFQWNNGASGSQLNQLSGGQYSFSMTDANGCLLVHPTDVFIEEPSSVQFVNIHVDCPVPGSGLAEIAVQASGGWYGEYQVSTDSGSTYHALGQTNFFLPVDSVYFIMIKDSSGCVSEIPSVIPVNPEVNIDKITMPVCFYEGDTIADVHVFTSGGVGGNYSVSFDHNQSFSAAGVNLFQLPTGTSYEVTATDSLGCISTSLNFYVNSIFLVNSFVSDFNGYAISCNGSANGSIDLSPTGGTQPYQFIWSDNTSNEDLIGLSAGTYSVIVSDQNYCRDTLVFHLSEPGLLIADSVLLSNYHDFNVSCHGSEDGQISMINAGGVGPYHYQWSNGLTTSFLQNVPAGNYQVTVTDANDCPQTFGFLLTEPAPLEVNILSLSNYNGYQISCNNMQNGFVDVGVNGGAGAISFLWNNGAMNQNLDSLSAGNYSLTVTDENGCIDSLTATLVEPPAMAMMSSDLSNYHGFEVSCNGFADGEINIAVSGGVGQSYSFIWSNGINSEDQYGLTAGSYHVTVYDINGCSINQSFMLNEPSALNITGGISSDYSGFSVSCYGSADGIIDISTTGGAGGYTYAWSNGASTEDLNVLPAGQYSVIITDLNSCSDTMHYLLVAPDVISIEENVQHILCDGNSNGAISLTVTGGVAPFSYLWSNGAVTSSLQNLVGGQYVVNINDQNNCIQNKIIAIQQIRPLRIEINSEQVKCFGGSDGKIDVEVNGGTPVYSYLWSNGLTQQNVNGLQPGLYIVNVTDANNCQESDTIIISQPDSLALSLNAVVYSNGHNLSSNNSNDGIVTSQISGGTAPYDFNWSNGSLDHNQINLSSGLYQLEITDKNGCKKSASIELDNPSQLELPTGFSPNGDGKNDQFIVRGLESFPQNSIFIFNRWGNLVFEKTNYQNDWTGKTTGGDQLPDGTYFVILEIHQPTPRQFNGYVDIRK